MTFRFVDRWQSSLGDLLGRALDEPPQDRASLSSMLGLLEKRDLDLERAVTPGPWTGVTFGSNWSNFDASPGRLVQFRMNGDRVELRGVAKATTVPVTAGTADSTICFLPVGFRPPSTDVSMAINVDETVQLVGIAKVDGSVYVRSGTVSNYVFLDGVSFSTLPPG